MEYISIDHLVTLVTIADEGSFSAAAEKIGRSQSAVSVQVRNLEAQLGKTIFKRGTRSLVLTRDGKLLLEYARKIVELNSEALSMIKYNDYKGDITIGLPDDYAADIMPDILAQFTASYPDVKLKVRCAPSRTLVKLLETSELDIALTNSERSDYPSSCILQKTKLKWISSDKHKQHMQRPLPLITYSGECYCKELSEKALQEDGIEYWIAYEAQNTSALSQAVMHGFGVMASNLYEKLDGVIELGEDAGFPTLPDAYVLLHKNVYSTGGATQFLYDYIRCKFSGNID